MKPVKPETLLEDNTYPGRGIIIGRSRGGERMIIAYFIMGRSENSRNRVFEATDDGIRTKAFDPEKLTDPSLVIYRPVRTYNGQTIVTNGDQTETIFSFLRDGQSFRSALLAREFEPDAPNYTPRISGLVDRYGGYKLSILKTMNGSPECCCRFFYEYSEPVCGVGHFISTYKSDGSPLPSFEGEPYTVDTGLEDGQKAFTDRLWNALDKGNKVSLFTREIVIATGEYTDIIINKNV